jgi:hypothetical protein
VFIGYDDGPKLTYVQHAVTLPPVSGVIERAHGWWQNKVMDPINEFIDNTIWTWRLSLDNYYPCGSSEPHAPESELREAIDYLSCEMRGKHLTRVSSILC